MTDTTHIGPGPAGTTTHVGPIGDCTYPDCADEVHETRLDQSVSEVAFEVLRRYVMDVQNDIYGEQWGNYPDLGEDDWGRVRSRLGDFLSSLSEEYEVEQHFVADGPGYRTDEVTGPNYAGAYGFLAGRAKEREA